VIFRNDDEGFRTWLDEHEGAFFINAEHNPKPNYLVLHIAGGCGHFTGSPSLQWTSYTKICSEQREELEGWAKQSVGGEVTLCKDCFR
jgi:hypothetical protein